MSTISNLLSSGYYSLSGQSSNSNAANTSATPSMAVALSAAQSAGGKSSEASYSLDLSPSALAYIQELNANATASGISTNAVTGYTLTRDQQATVNRILEDYKDAPFTQETFNEIQEALSAAGLSGKILAAQDKARNFNPTLFLLDALNGTSSEDMALGNLTGRARSDADDETKTANFMTSVADAWARISTTAQSATPEGE